MKRDDPHPRIVYPSLKILCIRRSLPLYKGIRNHLSPDQTVEKSCDLLSHEVNFDKSFDQVTHDQNSDKIRDHLSHELNPNTISDLLSSDLTDNSQHLWIPDQQ